MNIIEALRTNRPLRRPVAKHMGSSRSGWLGNQYVRDLLVTKTTATIFPDVHTTMLINESDLLADDWEVKVDLDAY
jgi:hypothetical protein